MRMLPRSSDERDIWIIVAYIGSSGLKHLHQEVTWGLAFIIYVGLVSQAKHQDGTAFEGLLLVVQGFDHPMDHVGGHGSVNLTCQLDEPGVLPIFAGFPS